MRIANDGRRALEIFEEYNPDLIMLDIMLPELDGWQVCQGGAEKIQVSDYYADCQGRSV